MSDTRRETMAETITDFMFRPFPDKKPYELKLPVLPFFTAKSRYKAQNCAFPREVVEREARRILEAHRGHLPGCDEAFISALMDDWRALPCAEVKLPKRYHGGILFGQLVPRFDNRIISTCPFTREKVATKNSFEFLRYRWAMQMLGIQVQDEESGKMRALNKEEREKLTEVIRSRGYFTEGEMKKTVREITGCKHDNLEALLLHPDAKEALQWIPIGTGREAFRAVWAGLNDKWRSLFAIQLQRGKVLSPQIVLDMLQKKNADKLAASVRESLHSSSLKKGKFDEKKHAGLIVETFHWKSPRGRAPFSRAHMRLAWEETMAGLNPRKKCKIHDPHGGEDKEQDGCLVVTETMQQAALDKPLDEQTNNHLVRHRLLILERLVRDIAADEKLTGGEKIAQVVIEVNRDLKEMSGKSAKEKSAEMSEKLKNFKSVVEYLESVPNLPKAHITPGLIRKARVAMDLNWLDPYTGHKFDAIDLDAKKYDKDHIIPYSQRPSNSLDSLVMTTPEINREKANRTAIEFIEDMNRPENLARRDKLGVWSVRQFRDFVDGLETRKGHDDDRKRKRRRQALLLLPKWDDKNAGFLPRDLTVTSQLTRLGAQAVRRVLSHLQPHEVVSIPGSVTGVLRTGWRLLGCLAQANPLVMDDEVGNGVKTKTEIREITHLHHALDACVLALTAHYIPKNGAFWEAVVKRTNTPEEKALLKKSGIFAEAADGKMHLKKDLPEGLKEKIASKLCEKRVVQHVPKNMGGMKVGENTHGIVDMTEDEVRIAPPFQNKDTWPKNKVVGIKPGKLSKQNGVRVIADNFGVAILDHLPPEVPAKDRLRIIPWHGVKAAMKRLCKENNGKPFRLIRKGDIIEITNKKGSKQMQVFGFGVKKRDGLYFDVGELDDVGRKLMFYAGGFMRDSGRVISRNYCGTLKSD